MAFKIPGPHGWIDLDAPSLPAYEWRLGPQHVFVVFCKHCGTWNSHLPGEGHRDSHCAGGDCPYRDSGYNLVRIGEVMGMAEFCRAMRAARQSVTGMLANGQIRGIESQGVVFMPVPDPEFRPSAPFAC